MPTVIENPSAKFEVCLGEGWTHALIKNNSKDILGNTVLQRNTFGAIVINVK